MQAGSWLWRAIPSSLRGLAGSRGCVSEAAPLEPQLEVAEATQNEGKVNVQPSPQRGQPEDNASTPAVQKYPPDGPPHDAAATATRQQDGLPARRRRPSASAEGNRHSSDTQRTAAIIPSGGPRPKRRRLVEAALGGQRGSHATKVEALRRHLAAFAREHLPLLGDLVCPHLEALGSLAGASRPTQDEMPPPVEYVSKELSEPQLSLRRAELQVLKGVTSFLLGAAEEFLGPMLEEPESSRDTSKNDSCNDSSKDSSKLNSETLERVSMSPPTLPGRCHHQASRSSNGGSVAAAQPQPAHALQPLLRELQRQQEEDDELSLLRLLQHSPSPRTSWSHGVFFKYAYVDLDFECLATFRICLCHHPLFIFYKEHEKGLHVLHVDGEWSTVSVLRSPRILRRRFQSAFAPAVSSIFWQFRNLQTVSVEADFARTGIRIAVDALGRCRGVQCWSVQCPGEDRLAFLLRCNIIHVPSRCRVAVEFPASLGLNSM